MSDFQASNPPKDQTNPNEAEQPTGAPYPRHLYKRVPADSEEGIVVAWAGKTPIRNVFVEVVDAAEEAARIAEGYALKPVVDEAPAKAAKK